MARIKINIASAQKKPAPPAATYPKNSIKPFTGLPK